MLVLALNQEFKEATRQSKLGPNWETSRTPISPLHHDYAEVDSSILNFADVVQFLFDGDWLEPRIYPWLFSRARWWGSMAPISNVDVLREIDVPSTSARPQAGESGIRPAAES